VDSSPAVAGNTVYVGSNDRNLYALSTTNGHRRWSFGTSGHVFSSPTVADGVVYFGSDDHSLYAVQA
jgi:outer membrane protein assembly factor BamB